MISNIWLHPQTSLAGVLLGATVITGVLTQQGVSLGHAGAGTVASLIGAIATALLGLVARDPGDPKAAPSSTAKLGCWALISLLLVGTLPMTGCTSQVAQDIVNWTPALQAAVATTDATVELIDPAAAGVLAAATVAFDAGCQLVVAQAKAYLANPTASVLALLQQAVTTFQQSVSASVLAAAKIVNAQSQAKALTAVNGVATIVSAILALVLTISSKASTAAMAAAAGVKMSAVLPYLDRKQAARMVAAHYGESEHVAAVRVAYAADAMQEAGF